MFSLKLSHGKKKYGGNVFYCFLYVSPVHTVGSFVGFRHSSRRLDMSAHCSLSRACCKTPRTHHPTTYLPHTGLRIPPDHIYPTRLSDTTRPYLPHPGLRTLPDHIYPTRLSGYHPTTSTRPGSPTPPDHIYPTLVSRHHPTISTRPRSPDTTRPHLPHPALQIDLDRKFSVSKKGDDTVLSSVFVHRCAKVQCCKCYH